MHVLLLRHDHCGQLTTATLEFLKQFFEHLMAGKSACNSLDQATKWMRESEKFCAVKNWAFEFVLIGVDVSLNFDQ